jgi:hypothetical protein
MFDMLLVVWGVALLVFLALAKVLVWTLRGPPQPEEDGQEQEEPQDLVADTLLLYRKEGNVRRTPQGDVVLRIPGSAWRHEWEDELVRFEVARLDTSGVVLPGEWGRAEVLAAYDLHASRMSQSGADVPIESFAAPVDVFLVAGREGDRLRFGLREEGTWRLAPPVALSLGVLQQVGIPAGLGWAVASIARLGQVCLVRSPNQ